MAIEDFGDIQLCMDCTVGSNKPFSTLNLRIKPGEGPIPEPAGICMLRIKKLPRRAQPGGGKPISGDHKTDENNPPSTAPQKRGPHRTTENATGRGRRRHERSGKMATDGRRVG